MDQKYLDKHISQLNEMIIRLYNSILWHTSNFRI